MKEKLVKNLLDLGEAMLVSGAEIHRVEDSLFRVCKNFGATRADVFVLTSVINVTATFSDGTQETQTRRVLKSASTDFNKLEQFNSLCRNTAYMSIDEFEAEIKKITAKNSNEIKIFIGSILAAFAFALFFGGTIIDASVAGLFAIAIYFLQKYFVSPNKVVFYFVTAFLIGIVIYAFKIFMPFLNVDKVIIGDIMLLIPGVAITNAMRDVVIGDTVSGIIKFAESLLWAVSLAGGFMLAMGVMGGLII